MMGSVDRMLVRNLPPRHLFVVTVSTLLGMGSLAAGIASGPMPSSWAAVGLLAVMAVAGELFPFEFAGRYRLSLATFAYIVAGATLGPLGAALVSIAGALTPAPSRISWYTYLGLYPTTGVLQGLIGANVNDGTSRGSALAVVAVGIATVVLGTAELAALSRPLGWSIRIGEATIGHLVAAALTIPFAVAGVRSLASEGSIGLLVLAIPLAGLFAIFRVFEQRDHLKDELDAREVAFVRMLAVAVDARDHYTATHSAAVATYARDTALALGWSIERAERVYLGGLVHDIGKLGIPQEILYKEGPLTEEERAVMDLHPVVGEEILARSAMFAELAPMIRSHHERVDGTGYPDRLVSGEAPEEALLIGIADAYNAMTTDRPYQAARPPEVAMEILEANAGTQFDPEHVIAFTRVLRSRSHAYRDGTSRTFHLEEDNTGALAELRSQIRWMRSAQEVRRLKALEAARAAAAGENAERAEASDDDTILESA